MIADMYADVYAQRTGIRAERLTVRYRAVVAVDAATVEVPPGSFLAVSGPSGAGKSSLLWALASALRPAEGTVLVDGEPVGDRTTTSGRGVVLIPQGNGLARILTARENIAVPLLANPPRRRRRDDLDEEESAEQIAEEVADRVDRALADVGLEDSGNHLVEELSGGEQQRIAVARGLALRGRCGAGRRVDQRARQHEPRARRPTAASRGPARRRRGDRDPRPRGRGRGRRACRPRRRPAVVGAPAVRLSRRTLTEWAGAGH
jgi:putative ABC transport system ATP-binding protein